MRPKEEAVINKKEKGDMTWDQLEAKWNEFAGSARAHWSKLTDDDTRIRSVPVVAAE